jgi:hypothetical protein
MRYILQARDIAQVNKTFKKENRTRVEAPRELRGAPARAHIAHIAQLARRQHPYATTKSASPPGSVTLAVLHYDYDGT